MASQSQESSPTPSDYLALQGPQELPGLAEHSQVEVVVVVGNADLARGGQSHTNREVAHCEGKLN